jgi:hypothetical protein
MARRMVVAALIVMGVAFGGLKLQCAQHGEKKEPYDAVPEDCRASLKRQIVQMVELQKKRQWSTIYDMVSTHFRVEPKDEFIRRNAHTSQLLDFYVDGVIHSPTRQNEWTIVGCALFERGGKRKAWRSSIQATLSDSTWSTSIVAISVAEVGGFTSCKTPE